MNRSATVLIVPLLSLLLAGLFAPQADQAATPPRAETFEAGVVHWLVSTAPNFGGRGSAPCSRTTGHETFPELQVFARLVETDPAEDSN